MSSGKANLRGGSRQTVKEPSGLGLRGYPNHTEFDLDDPRVQKIGTCMVAVICAEEPQVEDNTDPQEDSDAL